MSRVLRRADGPNLSNSCVSITFLFLITRTSTDQSTFMEYPSEDCRASFVDRLRQRYHGKLDLDMDMDKEGATLKNREGSKFLDKRSTQVRGASS